jgi:drug/metabolite transporter (DMT)-like permease
MPAAIANNARSQHRLGILLVVASSIAWSTAPFFVRQLAYDSWTILFWRGIFGSALIAAMLLVTQGRAGLASLVTMGSRGWLVASLSTLGMISFIPALQSTSVANVAVINASCPFVAAGLAWIWLREASKPRTLLATAVALCGVVVIVGGASTGSDVRGIALTCVMTLAIAGMTVAVRRYRDTPMVAAAALSNVLGTIVSAPLAQSITEVTAHDLTILMAMGVFQVAIGLGLYIFGSRLLPSGQAALIATLESPLMPFWVWLGFGEVPPLNALAGGALVLGAVLADIIGDLMAAKRPDAMQTETIAKKTVARIAG